MMLVSEIYRITNDGVTEQYELGKCAATFPIL